MEHVGEAVASFIGLDNSRFQDVLDGMTENQKQIAQVRLMQFFISTNQVCIICTNILRTGNS